MEPFATLSSRIVVIPIDNIDTDQIIPARYLRGTTRDGLGDNLFADWRRDQQGNLKPDFPLNAPDASQARVLVAGENFGCGSSREHAPWSLVGFGFRAVISTSIADIFKNNAVKNGLLPIEVPEQAHQFLLANPGSEVTIELSSNTLLLADGRSVHFPLEPFARHCMLQGMDTLDFLMSHDDRIEQFEKNRLEPI